jgi:prepilin-type N-terminal cleavage/methylation domain-containing protein/prepilin-type processing-associated H-X9-DG protein
MQGIRKSRGGFTLIELLVVTAILVVLAALLLPAVQKVREASMKIMCKNQMHQIALAAHTFHNDYGMLPPGYIGALDNEDSSSLQYCPSGTCFETNPAGWPDDTYRSQGIGHLPMLLPYLDNGPLYQEILTTYSTAAGVDPSVIFSIKDKCPPWFTYKAQMFPIAAKRIKVFECPSDRFRARFNSPPQAFKGTVVSWHYYHEALTGIVLNDVIEDGDDGAGGMIPGFPFGKTNYVGSSGAGGRGNDPTWTMYTGVYCNRIQRNLGVIANLDGVTYTVLYGETSSQCIEDGSGNVLTEAVQLNWLGVGAMLSGFGAISDGYSATHVQFSSNHPRGIHFAFVDGSVRTITPNPKLANTLYIEWEIFQQLNGFADGNTEDVREILLDE